MTDDQREYMTLDQAAEQVGLKKGSLYYYIRVLSLETKKFPLNKHTFMLKSDVERIRKIKEQPWEEEAA